MLLRLVFGFSIAADTAAEAVDPREALLLLVVVVVGWLLFAGEDG